MHWRKDQNGKWDEKLEVFLKVYQLDMFFVVDMSDTVEKIQIEPRGWRGERLKPRRNKEDCERK